MSRGLLEDMGPGDLAPRLVRVKTRTRFKCFFFKKIEAANPILDYLSDGIGKLLGMVLAAVPRELTFGSPRIFQHCVLQFVGFSG
jgi:hypothetical protein